MASGDGDAQVSGDGDARASGDGDAQPGGAGRPGLARPADATAAAPAEATAAAPAETLRAWDAAEARLFPLVMARPEDYERSLTVIQALLGWLRGRCQDVPALLAESARGAAIIDDAARELAGPGAAEGRDAGSAGDFPAATNLAAGPRGDLIAAAACAMRYRELVAAGAARGRLARFARAGAGGEPWAVVEESGDPARAPYLPYHRVEAHVPSGRSLIISIEPDESLRAVWRLDEGQLDLASGGLAVGEEVGSYASAAEFDGALARARARLG
jgi:hypothetical protein